MNEKQHAIAYTNTFYQQPLLWMNKRNACEKIIKRKAIVVFISFTFPIFPIISCITVWNIFKLK